jgi:hypothetical protein
VIEKLNAFPTAKRKNGNTRSVGVHPFHGACRKGAYTNSQLPGLFTRIIPATVIPRNTSRERKREGLEVFEMFWVAGVEVDMISVSYERQNRNFNYDR